MTENLPQHASDLLHKLEGAIGVVKVERRSPVHRFVLSDATGGAITAHEVVVGGIHVEARGAVDGVNVLCNFIGVHQRVQPGKTNAATAGHAPEGSGALDGGQEEEASHIGRVRIEGVKLLTRIYRENVKRCFFFFAYKKQRQEKEKKER